jgi:hypothetical protein
MFAFETWRSKRADQRPVGNGGFEASLIEHLTFVGEHRRVAADFDQAHFNQSFQVTWNAALNARRCTCGPMTASARRSSIGRLDFYNGRRPRALMTPLRIKPTSPRRHSAWRPNLEASPIDAETLFRRPGISSDDRATLRSSCERMLSRTGVRCSPIQSDPLRRVPPLRNRLPPWLVVDVPAHCLANPSFEILFRAPS